MKNFGLLIVFLFTLFSCENDQGRVKNSIISELSPEEIGQLHNRILREIDCEILNKDEIKSVDEFTDVEIKILEGKIQEINQGRVTVNHHVYEIIGKSNQTVYDYSFLNNKSHTAANDELASQLLIECEELFSNEKLLETLNPKEVIILKAILDSFKSYEETRNIEKLKSELIINKHLISNAEFDPTTTDGFLSEMTISVAENSIKYWTIDSLTRYGGSSKIVWWAVSDAVGAVICAGGTVLKDALNDEEIDWTDVAVDGLVGAVGASIPGGKGFKRLVKQLF